MPNSFTQVAVNIIFSASIYLLVAVSFSLMYYTTRVFHIFHGAVISTGAYLTFLFYSILSFPFVLSVIIALIVSCFIGIVPEVIVYKKMRKRKLPALTYLILSIGLYMILQNVLSLCFGDATRVIVNNKIETGHKVFNAYLTTSQLASIFVSMLLFLFVFIFLHHTRSGKSIRAVASNRDLCMAFGINPDKVTLLAYGIASVIGAISGILVSLDTNMTPTFGFNLLLYGIVAMIISGVGSIRGLVAGAFLLSACQHIAGFFMGSQWMNAMAYIILILFLLWRPLGFSGKYLKKVEV